MASGIAVNDACIDTYLGLKMKRQYRFVTCVAQDPAWLTGRFKISDDLSEIVVDRAEPADSSKTLQDSYDAFVASLPADEGRYAVYDMVYDAEDGTTRSKLCFFAWVPEAAAVKQKMLYASSQDALARKLEGVAGVIQANDGDDVELAEVLSRF
jgi:cofilin